MSNSKHIVLIVDDANINLSILSQILAKEYVVLTAQNGTQALAMTDQIRPDLILLDLLMPGMNGFEVLSRLKASEDTKSIPVIIITGLNNPDDEEKGFTLGAVDYITRPFHSTTVLARVRTHIQMLEQLRTIEQLSMIDPLTEIANRRSFDRHVHLEWKRAIRGQKPLSFIMIDIDHFKRFNDTYGHMLGDELLRTLARVFAASARRPGDIAARLGGEEFGLLLPDTLWESGYFIAEKLRQDVRSARVPTSNGSELTSITVSCGLVTRTPLLADNIADFIALGDKCLYEAKAAGRDQIVGRIL